MVTMADGGDDDEGGNLRRPPLPHQDEQQQQQAQSGEHAGRGCCDGEAVIPALNSIGEEPVCLLQLQECLRLLAETEPRCLGRQDLLDTCVHHFFARIILPSMTRFEAVLNTTLTINTDNAAVLRHWQSIVLLSSKMAHLARVASHHVVMRLLEHLATTQHDSSALGASSPRAQRTRQQSPQPTSQPNPQPTSQPRSQSTLWPAPHRCTGRRQQAAQHQQPHVASMVLAWMYMDAAVAFAKRLENTGQHHVLPTPKRSKEHERCPYNLPARPPPIPYPTSARDLLLPRPHPHDSPSFHHVLGQCIAHVRPSGWIGTRALPQLFESYSWSLARLLKWSLRCTPIPPHYRSTASNTKPGAT
ncbi:hypothetical protein PTSG_04810 [Salpingoeca rosetta]|uniref:Uncharacterized protein n=1 Tax=Salpingoeca rosetta (strain ATCC 50818 / BSB-021) TaxID=946362 RepID=F2U9S0_SALR5|nr:uncharacterized protein PTSG_04810 [Salpingoeca rosetta]EGD73097.1 hypothetical protein PTSG_04810 [Salpingoeca rosetta]|eukprot:XP_004994128.1 hypothetical protein PTSG_04810 [Salpingoeca rosetta]